MNCADKMNAARAMLAALLRIQGDLKAIMDHDAELNGTEAKRWEDARPPTGDDYNVIHDHAMDALRSIPEIVAQARAAGISTQED